MTRTPSDACFFVGMMAAATAAGAWLYGDSTWFTGALITAVIATVAWAITHKHETQPIPYTTTVRYDIDQLFRQQRAEWEQRTTCTHDLCIEGRDIHIINADRIEVDHRAIWPHELGAPE